ncbi:polyketide cyclase / dehydrase and lipid transport family protein [Rhodococcus sp. MTM3W5.2]|uniref:SRPBCC family protein n=1 Tax=Rhodococcus sp. MTM3W5.2 TaxID=1805827 RepID=UPI00097908D1|nr:SRPBCC family protein [Rhodococcus sp. MTM3W5.2]AQA25356.1 polyketide cyclase / dehydrase and lipid transport family protein [Rhodococcus sp. MTM3W5.2]
MTYTKTAVLPISPDEAFALLTEPERLRRWQTVSAVVDLRAGGSYRWTVTPGHIAEGTFREVEPGRRIVFGWGWGDNADLPYDGSTVTVTVEPTDGGSLVTLVHEGLNAEQAKSHAEGWDHYFERLERMAATGDAGPDEWAYAPENLTPVVAAEAALAVLQPILRNLTTEDRSKPTPCAEFTCHELAEHLFASLVQLGAMAGAPSPVPYRDRWRTASRPSPAEPSTPGTRSTSTAPCPAQVARRFRHRSPPGSCRSNSRCMPGTSPRRAVSPSASPMSSWTTSAVSPRLSSPAVGDRRSPRRSPRPGTPPRSIGSRRSPGVRRSPRESDEPGRWSPAGLGCLRGQPAVGG